MTSIKWLTRSPESLWHFQGSWCMHPASKRQCYNVASSLIGWAHTQNDPYTVYVKILSFPPYSIVMYMAEVCSLRDPPEQDSHSHLLVSHLAQSHTWHLIMQVSRKQYSFQIYFYFHTAVYCVFSLKSEQTKNPNKQKNFVLSDVFLKSCKITKAKMFGLVLFNVNISATYIFSCDQAALWMVFSVRLSVCPSVRLSVRPSVRLSVCLSVCHTFLTMFPSSYHHEIFRSYHIGPG